MHHQYTVILIFLKKSFIRSVQPVPLIFPLEGLSLTASPLPLPAAQACRLSAPQLRPSSLSPSEPRHPPCPSPAQRGPISFPEQHFTPVIPLLAQEAW